MEATVTVNHRTVEEERLHRKERLAAAFRLFSKFGFDHGEAGHITARDPEYPDHFWVNPYRMHFSQIKVSDLVLANDKGEVVEGDHEVNKAALVIHSAVHKARPDAIAAAHAHSTYGQIWSTTGKLLEPLTQDSCAFYKDHSVFADYTGVVLEKSEGERIGEALGNYKATILRNHGLLTVGKSVEEAAWWFILMERSCREHVYAHAIGNPIKIDEKYAEITYQQEGTQEAAEGMFQPLWDRIVAEQPDFLN
ncbi:class II aldolase/adducin family protein [Siminovitchia acidinfaciens]|uniref:Class II aldolase/adducin family protein n=1 Tax=Siminovitchia acidinfaciens TaxID=2321395 RepID=A0A429Y717_9BACI|nr:class II aldolase/adducin family protein [Siminovitchia acidinfaciens]RST77182.1 class II aldolase/adducin family protein [Siminovitchia acidinfaciens]